MNFFLVGEVHTLFLWLASFGAFGHLSVNTCLCHLMGCLYTRFLVSTADVTHPRSCVPAITHYLIPFPMTSPSGTDLRPRDWDPRYQRMRLSPKKRTAFSPRKSDMNSRQLGPSFCPAPRNPLVSLPRFFHRLIERPVFYTRVLAAWCLYLLYVKGSLAVSRVNQHPAGLGESLWLTSPQVDGHRQCLLVLCQKAFRFTCGPCG